MESWMWCFLLCSHLLIFYFSPSHSLCHPHDNSALLHFKNSFTIYEHPYYSYYCDHGYSKTRTWENGRDCCSWAGVSCHPISGHVTQLDLSCSGLHGNIDPNSTLFHLSHLHSLNLAFNHLYTSQLSSLFGGFVSLTHLNLSHSEFEGNIPSQISHLSKLVSLDLSYNLLKWKEDTWKSLLKNATVLKVLLLDYTDMSSISIRTLNMSSSLVTLGLLANGLSGKLTDGILCLPNLQYLYLSFNEDLHGQQLPEMSCSTTSLGFLDLSGCGFQGSIPPSFFNLTHLTSLDLSANNLNGTVPSSLLTLPRLTFLNLNNNQLSGQIPNIFPKSNNFHELHLSYNNIEGEIPSTLSNLQHLIILDLSLCDFQGSIPPSFSNLILLTSLDLSYNHLNGSVPSSLLTLPRLTFLNLNANCLSGQIPNVFLQSNNIHELDLSNNKIEGELPSTLSNLQHLILLDLSHNKFIGQIPDVFVGLTKLNSLNLSDNNLGGPIPSSLFGLTQLSYLDCSNNKLEGPLPNKIRGFSNLTSLRLYGNFLNGTIPSWCLSLPSLVDLYLSENQFSGHISVISSYSLVRLSLSHNKLQGNIPDTIFSLVNLTDLDLSSNNLSGSVNFPLFSKLQNLERLNLSHNNQLSLNFKSNVNYSFSSLWSLDLSSTGLTEFPKLSGKVPILKLLHLSNNTLKGRVPNWLHDTNSSLYLLDLSHNLLTQSLDQFSWNQHLVYLDLSFNSITAGSSSICNATAIEVLNLSHNKLTGTIPQCLINSSTLEVLDLQLNKLHGPLPSTFAKNCQLRTLDLNGNQLLEGFLPESLSNCINLEVLNLGNNQIKDVFPHWLQTLPELKVLVLRANKLYGPIEGSKTKHGFPSLVIFDVSSNNFSGSIPNAYIKKFEAMKNVVLDPDWQYMEISISFAETNYHDSVTITTKAITMTMDRIRNDFVSIDLSKNRFEGGIPNAIGELHSLRGLNLSHNRLIGPIPQSMGNLRYLESLDLSSNMLIGGIPTELSNLNFLEVLNLSNNHLVGEIPRGQQFNTFPNDSYKGNSGLCGLPLTIKCSKDPEQHSPPSTTFRREPGFGFGWKPVAIGYGCGMVFGVGMGCCVLLIGKPQWLVRMVGGKLNKKVKRKTRMRSNENGSRMN